MEGLSSVSLLFHNMDLRDGTVGIGACYQAQGPESSTLDTHGESKQVTPQCCPLNSALASRHMPLP